MGLINGFIGELMVFLKLHLWKSPIKCIFVNEYVVWKVLGCCKSNCFEKTRADQPGDPSDMFWKAWIWDTYFSKNMKLKSCNFHHRTWTKLFIYKRNLRNWKLFHFQLKESPDPRTFRIFESLKVGNLFELLINYWLKLVNQYIGNIINIIFG